MPYRRGKKWVAQVKIDGKKVAQKVFAVKKDAIVWEAQTEKEIIMAPQETTVSTVSLLSWAHSYLDYSKAIHGKTTHYNKKRHFRFLFQYEDANKNKFKYIDPSLPATKLTGGVILKVMLGLLTKTSGDAANRFRKDLLAAWAWGMTYLDPPLPGPNPCKVKKMPAAESPRYVPPEEDFWKLYDYVSEADKVMLLTFLHTAGRVKEVFSLKWDDVDFENKSIRLWTRKREGANFESDWIPMVNELCEALEWWRENTPIKKSVFVFNCVEAKSPRYGLPFEGGRTGFMFDHCRRAGIKHFGFHSIRHLRASLLFRNNCPIAVIQKILRHRNPMTTTRYLHSMENKEVRRIFEQIVGEKSVRKLGQPRLL
jgi:integrase